MALLVAGSLILLFETGLPLRAILLWRSFSNLSSWLSIGAWLLAASILASAVFFLLTMLGYEKDGVRWWIICPICIMLGLGVCLYTGLLLMSAGAVVSWSTPILPALLTTSSLSAGIASFLLVARNCESRLKSRRSVALSRVGFGFSIADLMLLISYFVFLAANDEMVRLSFDLVGGIGVSAAILTIITGVGFIAPVAISGYYIITRLQKRTWSNTGSICTMIGSCAIRFWIVLTGIHIVAELI